MFGRGRINIGEQVFFRLASRGVGLIPLGGVSSRPPCVHITNDLTQCTRNYCPLHLEHLQCERESRNGHTIRLLIRAGRLMYYWTCLDAMAGEQQQAIINDKLPCEGVDFPLYLHEDSTPIIIIGVTQ